MRCAHVSSSLLAGEARVALPFWLDGLSGKGGVCLWQDPLAAQSRWHSSSCRHQSASLPRGGRAAHVWACSTGDARREREQQRLRAESWQNASETWDVWGRVVSSRPTCPLGEPRSIDAAQEAVTAGAAHRHRSVLKRRSCRHRGGGRARCVLSPGGRFIVCASQIKKWRTEAARAAFSEWSSLFAEIPLH